MRANWEHALKKLEQKQNKRALLNSALPRSN